MLVTSLGVAVDTSTDDPPPWKSLSGAPSRCALKRAMPSKHSGEDASAMRTWAVSVQSPADRSEEVNPAWIVQATSSCVLEDVKVNVSERSAVAAPAPRAPAVTARGGATTRAATA